MSSHLQEHIQAMKGVAQRALEEIEKRSNQHMALHTPGEVNTHIMERWLQSQLENVTGVMTTHAQDVFKE